MTLEAFTARCQKARARDSLAQNALGVYAQIFAGFSMYLYGNVGTPGYLCLPLAMLCALPLWAMGRTILRRGTPGADKMGIRALYGCLALLRLIDGQIIFSCFCAFIRDVMPDASVWAMALAAALFCSFALDGKSEALPALGRLLKWLVGGLFAYCLLIALPYGKADHFFPLLGRGEMTVVSGALWLFGAVCGGVWPLILHGSPEEEKGLLALKKPGLLPWAAAVGVGMAAYLLSVWLLPVYAMAKPQSLGWRLMLVAHMTPSIPAWSMEVIGLTLLFALTLCHCVSQTGDLLALCAKKAAPSRWTPLALLLLLIPAGAADTENIRQALSFLAFLRGPAMLLLGGCLFLSRVRKREEKA